jgi:hypothetical protein
MFLLLEIDSQMMVDLTPEQNEKSCFLAKKKKIQPEMYWK